MAHFLSLSLLIEINAIYFAEDFYLDLLYEKMSVSYSS